MKKRLFLTTALVLLAGCAKGPTPETFIGPKLNLLFLGNSYTYVNNLPQMLTELAKSGHHEISTDLYAPGGWTLAQHANSADALAKINGHKWDYVVLQEQSVLPTVEKDRTEEMYPAIRFLDFKIKQGGARSLLYMTWGRQNGFAEAGYVDFNSMQEQLTKAYLVIANALGIPVAPVGEAWKAVRGADPSLSLWQGDGSHPTLEGTYLAACVFYETLYRESPEGLSYTADLSKKSASFLQAVSAKTVLTEPERWNIR